MMPYSVPAFPINQWQTHGNDRGDLDCSPQEVRRRPEYTSLTAGRRASAASTQAASPLLPLDGPVGRQLQQAERLRPVWIPGARG